MFGETGTLGKTRQRSLSHTGWKETAVVSIQGWCGWSPASSKGGRAPEAWEAVWTQEGGQNKAGPAEQAGGLQDVRAAPSVRKGPGKVETGECILDLQVETSLASEKWCTAKPGYKSSWVRRERWESSLVKEKAREGSNLRWFGIQRLFSNFKLSMVET